MLSNRFDINDQALPKSKRSERVTIEMSRYDLEIIMRSLEESYLSELSKTPWVELTPGAYPPKYERQVVFVDRFYPSSKMCNHCGYVKKDLKLSDRQWICPVCGEVIDRDYNAACNIKDEGIRIYKEQIGSSSPEFKLVDYPTMDDKREISLKSSDRMKQEKNVF